MGRMLVAAVLCAAAACGPVQPAEDGSAPADAAALEGGMDARGDAATEASADAPALEGGGDAGPDAPACVLGDPRACYEGPDGTAGVGPCRRGSQVCMPDGRWSACTGQVLPAPERCNGMDEDCDGRNDNGIDLQTDPANCGSCGRRCEAPYIYCAAASCQRDPPSDGGPICLAAEIYCAGACVSRDDLAHCGTCTETCAALTPGAHQRRACVAGRCALACDAGYGDCDGMPANGCEVDLARHGQNCGACGVVCGPAQLCLAGECR